MRKRNALVVTLLALAMLVVLLFPAGAASNKDKVFQELTRQGLNTAAACGVMANIDKESTFKPTATSRGGSYGLCQWTGSRKTDLFNFCSKNGLDASTVEGQIDFLLYELQTGYKSVWNTLKSTPNTADGAYNAAYRFCYDFERPASKASRSSERASLAKSTYWPAYKGFVTLNGIVKGTDGKWALYENGEVKTGYTGIAENANGWWRIENGYVNFGANGVYKNEYGWWRVEGGKVTFEADGIYKNEYGWWKTTDSKVTFNETGVFENPYGVWYVENSKVDFSKNGQVTYNGVLYNVENGKATVATAAPTAPAAAPAS